jgi:uncharacterized protein YhfF
VITPNELWQEYVESLAEGVVPANNYTAWHFCDNEPCANDLLKLVLDGRKVATCTALWLCQLSGETLPSIGDISIITNWTGDAKCIIRTTDVTIKPFDKVDDHFAALEGEGNQSLKHWREVHWDYFDRQLSQYGKKSESKMPIVCEIFEVIYPGGI